ncbi:hypothetical protein DICPUDRAFT_158740 [Dictyostelium purpureum]|uniref:Uncharacterized protein n=1 Tax=Dictyostelium purpureum TaxID=5786 RepID=F1A2C5_DICPU|nr:uncharacterized protein DICPUDRAFT_158740 [Dictyostelium purpureum]EGC29650.1 hypothetical protein DICPUDRAFT_158740 [Dictyostelium purpureum]|eukprot:XP_003293819.1 hypothetical protein DICPUDRAFT_158740 [Dictyostelium purpureum]
MAEKTKLKPGDIVSKKLQSIIEPISYDHISDDSVWEDYSILEDIEEISKLLISNTQLKLQELLPNFIYLLRDRMIHKPTDIQYILPLVFKVLEIANPNEIDGDDEIKKYLTPFQFKTILSLLSSLVLIDPSTTSNNDIVIHNTNNHKNIPQSSITCLSKYIYQLLPYLVDRIAFWNSIPNDQFQQISTSKLEFESISNLIYFYSENPLKNIDSGNWGTTIIHKGILSQFIAIIVYKLMISFNSGVDILLDKLCKLCCKSNLLTQFIQKVPEFMNLVLSNQEFIQIFPQYHLVWIFIFKCCYPLEIKNTQTQPTIKRNNLDETTTIIAQDIDDNIKSFVEKLENEYQSMSFSENENKKLEQLDVILNILLEAKTKISNRQLSEKLFTNENIQSMFNKFEKQIVLIKINQHRESQQQPQEKEKKTKAQKKSLENTLIKLKDTYLNVKI